MHNAKSASEIRRVNRTYRMMDSHQNIDWEGLIDIRECIVCSLAPALFWLHILYRFISFMTKIFRSVQILYLPNKIF